MCGHGSDMCCAGRSVGGLTATTSIVSWRAAAAPYDRQLLLDQAAMIGRLSLASVDGESDQADIERAYQAVLRSHAELSQVTAEPLAG